MFRKLRDSDYLKDRHIVRTNVTEFTPKVFQYSGRQYGSLGDQPPFQTPLLQSPETRTI